MQRRKLTILLMLALTISIVTLCILTRLSIIEAKTLPKIPIQFVILAIIFVILQQIFIAIRYKVLLKGLGLIVSLKYITKVVLAQTFLSLVSPTYYGGEVVTIYLFSRINGSSVGISTMVVLWKYILDSTALAILAIISILYLRPFISHQIPFTLIAICVLVIPVLFAYLFSYGITKSQKVARLLYVIEKFIGKIVKVVCRFSPLRDRISANDISLKVSNEIDSFIKATQRLLRERPSYLIVSFAITFLHWFSLFLAGYTILLGLLGKFSLELLIEFSLLQSLYIAFLSIAFTPGASGFAEIGFYVLYSSLVSKGVCGAFTVWYRIVTFYILLILSAPFFIRALSEKANP